MGIGLAHNYESFLLFRLGIGVIGASFVITQYHTSVMFAPERVSGTAKRDFRRLRATLVRRRNPDGPCLWFSPAFIGAGLFGFLESWRLSMVVAGAVCFLVTGIAYYFFTTGPAGRQLQGT